MNNNEIHWANPPGPNQKTAKHPVLPATITFDQASHQYIDETGADYVSVTTLLKAYFPPFDSAAAAARIAARENRLEMDILAEWKAKSETASKYGTACHAYAEAVIIGATAPKPADDRQRRSFGIIDRTLTMLEPAYELYPPEQIVFDPLYRLAGTIDLPARNRETDAFTILDWKTNETVSDNPWGRKGLGPLARIDDCDMMHYACQLSLYAEILGAYYIEAARPVEMALIHIPHTGDDPNWIPLDDCRAAARGLLAHWADVHARCGYGSVWPARDALAKHFKK